MVARHDTWEIANLWDDLTMDERFQVLKEAGVEDGFVVHVPLDKKWWTMQLEEDTIYALMAYDVQEMVGPILKKMVATRKRQGRALPDEPISK